MAIDSFCSEQKRYEELADEYDIRKSIFVGINTILISREER